MSAKIQLTDSEFDSISQYILRHFGINLTQKKDLVFNRLHPDVQHGGFKSFDAFFQSIFKDPSGNQLTRLMNKLTTNHTSFYREKMHMDYLKETALPALVAQGHVPRVLRVWCAGCSSGEETYTLAIECQEFMEQNPEWRIAMLATDISEKVLSKAQQGHYSEDRIQNIPEKLRQKYFTKTPSGLWEVSNTLKSLVMFRRLNFMRATFPFKNEFHVIFCRNVMIYFEEDTKQELAEKFSRHLSDSGYLFIGMSETLGIHNPHFKHIEKSIYQKRSLHEH